VLLLAILAFAVYDQKPAALKAQTDSKKITSSARQAAKTKSISAKTTIAPTKSSSVVSPPAVAVTKKKAVTSTVVPAGIRTSTKVEPVVTPSPSSSVSSLTPTAPTTTPSPTPVPPTTTSYTSTNWSGYLATSSNYTQISGSWQAPNVTGNGSTTSADASWIGVGGVTSNDLIQVGTQDTVSSSGTVTTSAFYEMLPAASIDITSISVSPGDQMSANINETSTGQWAITITDNTSGQTYTKNVSYTSSNSSAEWIEEDPSYSSRRQIPFDNFGLVNFKSALTTSNGASLNLNSASAQPVTMVNQSDQPIATPSSINSDGMSFSINQDN
jgi:hypothetical protein